MEKRDILIPARDGFSLAATIYDPKEASDRKNELIIISSATAVPRRLYHSFATFFAERGYTVITYDYRGTGGSRPKLLRGFSAQMREWVEKDMAGVVQYSLDEIKPKKLFHIGHSFGGQSVGLLEYSSDITATVAIAAQSGYWRFHEGREKIRTVFYIYFLFPVLSILMGYFPWSKILAGEDLPAGVAREWASWCRNPEYIFGDKTLQSLGFVPLFNRPMLAWNFKDDHWCSPSAVEGLFKWYAHIKPEIRLIEPKEYGLRKIGHFGFFLPRARVLWLETEKWLGQQ